MYTLLLLSSLTGCAGTPAPPPAPATETPMPSDMPAGAADLTTVIRVGLVSDKPRPLSPLKATVELMSAASDHGGERLQTEHSSGTVRLAWDGHTLDQPWVNGVPFPVWGLQLAVFGASGSHELAVFPPGVPVEP